MNLTDWGTPTASYPASACNITQYFQPQQLVLDITLCGVWWVLRIFISFPDHLLTTVCVDDYRAGVPSIYNSTGCSGQCVSLLYGIFFCPLLSLPRKFCSSSLISQFLSHSEFMHPPITNDPCFPTVYLDRQRHWNRKPNLQRGILGYYLHSNIPRHHDYYHRYCGKLDIISFFFIVIIICFHIDFDVLSECK